ncbi:MAG: hypothetical protein ACK50V_02655 [Alphaproteobacteria bacterium]|nr:hypothetical protein [Alphaproteobacteria bacterium]
MDLESVDIKGFAALKSIGRNFFYGCSNLQNDTKEAIRAQLTACAIEWR